MGGGASCNADCLRKMPDQSAEILDAATFACYFAVNVYGICSVHA